MNLTILPVNDDPVLVPSSSLTATVTANGPNGSFEGGGDDFRVTLTAAMLDATDVDSPDTQVTFVLTQIPGQGKLLLNGAALTTNSTFTLDDVKSGRVQFLQTSIAGSGATDNFHFTLVDNAQSLRWDDSPPV